MGEIYQELKEAIGDCLTDIYITIHNSSEITLSSSSEIILWLGESPQHEELY